jgi:hypothetical protein
MREPFLPSSPLTNCSPCIRPSLHTVGIKNNQRFLRAVGETAGSLLHTNQPLQGLPKIELPDLSSSHMDKLTSILHQCTREWSAEGPPLLPPPLPHLSSLHPHFPFLSLPPLLLRCVSIRRPGRARAGVHALVDSLGEALPGLHHSPPGHRITARARSSVS